jgi:hypothetical protein
LIWQLPNAEYLPKRVESARPARRLSKSASKGIGDLETGGQGKGNSRTTRLLLLLRLGVEETNPNRASSLI